MTQPMLPAWGRAVIFVDWHGVLSKDLFWSTILADPRHPLHSSLRDELAVIFAKDGTLAHEWMRGERSSADIIADMRLTLPPRYRADYLERKLANDLRTVSINTELVGLLGTYRPEVLVVVATDNMDCFATAFDRVRISRRPRRGAARVPVPEFAACVARCDDVLCSSDVGALKSEKPGAFFGPWLERQGLTFADAVLIDDRADNCAAFAAQGGRSLRWKLGTDRLTDLHVALEGWSARHGRPRLAATIR